MCVQVQWTLLSEVRSLGKSDKETQKVDCLNDKVFIVIGHQTLGFISIWGKSLWRYVCFCGHTKYDCPILLSWMDVRVWQVEGRVDVSSSTPNSVTLLISA